MNVSYCGSQEPISCGNVTKTFPAYQDCQVGTLLITKLANSDGFVTILPKFCYENILFLYHYFSFAKEQIKYFINKHNYIV